MSREDTNKCHTGHAGHWCWGHLTTLLTAVIYYMCMFTCCIGSPHLKERRCCRMCRVQGQLVMKKAAAMMEPVLILSTVYVWCCYGVLGCRSSVWTSEEE